MKAAKMNSPRLIRTLSLLDRGGEYSTLDIVIGANVMAVSAVISELRQNGVEIECNRRCSVWYYKKAETFCNRVPEGQAGAEAVGY